MSEETGPSVEVKIPGGGVNLKNFKHLNDVATVAILILVSLIGYTLFAHASDTKDAGKELVSALKEMTQAAREQNCLMAFPSEKREANAELCKRLSR